MGLFDRIVHLFDRNPKITTSELTQKVLKNNPAKPIQTPNNQSILENKIVKPPSTPDISEYEPAQYSFSATLDDRTCPVCGHLDGKIFNSTDKKVGVNYPNMHKGCRCTTNAHLPDWPRPGKRWMRDPQTRKGRTIDYMTYDEWAKQYLSNNPD